MLRSFNARRNRVDVSRPGRLAPLGQWFALRILDFPRRADTRLRIVVAIDTRAATATSLAAVRAAS